MAARKKPAGSTQEERDRISLGVIESYMDGLIKDLVICPSCKKGRPVKEISAGAVQLIRARYDKLRPTLSAVEQTYADSRDSADPAQIEAKLRALFDARPELFSFIASPSNAAAQQSDQIAQGIGSNGVTH